MVVDLNNSVELLGLIHLLPIWNLTYKWVSHFIDFVVQFLNQESQEK